MQKSDSIKELATALAKAQAEIKGAVKDATNPHFRSKYADLSSVVEAIRMPLAKHQLAYVQLTIPSDKNEVQVETILMHASGEWVSGIIAVPVAKNDAQGFGSALTYARRYGLSAAVGVAPEDDDGNAAAAAKPANDREADRILSAGVHPAAGVWESLDPDMQIFLSDLAAEVKADLKDGAIGDALTTIQQHNLDADQKVALNTRFDSKERSAMKKFLEAQKTKEGA